MVVLKVCGTTFVTVDIEVTIIFSGFTNDNVVVYVTGISDVFVRVDVDVRVSVIVFVSNRVFVVVILTIVVFVVVNV